MNSTRFPSSSIRLMLLGSAGIFYALLLPYYYVGMLSDDAIYVLGAQSLLHGHYRAVWDVGPPQAPLYPPGFSLFLAPFVMTFGIHSPLLKCIPVVLMMVSGTLLFSLARTWLTPGLSLLAMAAFLFNPATVYSSCLVMSESLLVPLMLGSFLLLRRILSTRNPSWEPWLLGGLLGYAMLVRYTGVGLLVAVVMALFYARRRESLYCLLISTIISGSFIFWNFMTSHQLTGYSSTWRSNILELAQPSVFLMRWMQATHMMFANDLLSVPLPYTKSAFILRSLLSLAVVCLMASRFRSWKHLSMETRVMTVAAGFLIAGWYGIHALYGATYSRYAWPSLPYIIILFIAGCHYIYSRTSKSIRRAWVMGICLIAAFYAHANADFVRRATSRSPMWRPPDATAQWIRDNTPADAVFLYVKPSELYLYTARQGYDEQIAKDIDHFRYLLLTENVSYILSRPFRNTYNDYLSWRESQRWAGVWPEAFKLVFADPDEATKVYHVISDPRFVEAYELYKLAARDFNHQDFTAGLKKLDAALSLDPRLVSALNAYGAGCLLADKNLKTAEVRLKEAVRLQPDHAIALYNLARVYKLTGHPDLAQRYLARARDVAQSVPEYNSALPMIDHGV